MAKRVKQEIEKIEKLLKRDDLIPKQKLALSIALYTITWQDSLGRERMDTLPSPSEKIMQAT